MLKNVCIKGIRMDWDKNVMAISASISYFTVDVISLLGFLISAGMPNSLYKVFAIIDLICGISHY